MQGFNEALAPRDAARCDWVIGDVAGPWRMRILAKCTRNMVVFNEVCSDESHSGRWVNLCSAVVSADGERMEGIWMQTHDGVVIVSPHNSGTFEATRTAVPPAGADHVEWYFANREARRRAWRGQTEGGLVYDGEAEGSAGADGDAPPPEGQTPEPAAAAAAAHP